jgi:hypothetical protein
MRLQSGAAKAAAAPTAHGRANAKRIKGGMGFLS